MRYLLIVFCFLISLAGYAQNVKIDSLEKVIATTKVDTVKGRSLCRLCDELRKIGDYETGLKKGSEGLAITEKTKDRMDIAVCLINIGNIYYSQSNYPKALECYTKSLKIREAVGEQNAIAKCLMNIGNIYFSQSNYPKALDYAQKSLKIREQIGDKFGIALCQLNIANIYYSQGNYPKALDYTPKSLKIREQIGDKAGTGASNSNIGLVYVKLKQPLLAKEYARKGLQIAREVKHLQYMKEGAKVSYQADSALGDYKSAFVHHKLYKQYSDSLYNEDKAKEFGRVESKYQFEKETQEAERKQSELAKIEAEKTERRNNLQYLTIFAGIIGLFAGLVFMGKFKIPKRLLDVAIFAGLLITFEFLLILCEPIFEEYSGGIPFYKLGFNTLIAFGFAPLHGLLEEKLKKGLAKRKQ